MRLAIINWLTIVYTKPLTHCLAFGKNPVNIRHQRYDHAAVDDDDVGRVFLNYILNTCFEIQTVQEHSLSYWLFIMPVGEGRQIKGGALRYQMGKNEATR